MKKMRKRFVMMLIAVLVLICFPAVPARAEGGGYTYTVRFYSGQQGTFANGQNVIIYEGLSYGSIVTFNSGGGNVVLNNGSKYYVKGIRESGRDNNTVSASSFVVTGDRDYVVAYGLRGNMVSYTVNYVDLNGDELAPSEIFYGNVGDKPVVAFLYIDGYQPQAYNLTKTLSENEAENVFTFVYVPVSGVNTGMTTTRMELPGRSVVEVIPGEVGGRFSRSIIGSKSGNTGRSVTNGPIRAGASGLADPLDSIDLDGIDLEDPAVPLADMTINLGPIEMDARMLLIIMVVIADILIIAAVSYWYWKPYRKKENNEEKNASQPV